MHIGIVSPCSSGPLADLLPHSGEVDLGCGVHFMATLVRALIDRGHRVSVITLSPKILEPRILRGIELTYYVYPMRTHRRMRDLYRWSAWDSEKVFAWLTLIYCTLTGHTNLLWLVWKRVCRLLLRVTITLFRCYDLLEIFIVWDACTFRYG
jgi:hypothetical protein